MTLSEALLLPPGPELDALVAEKVMFDYWRIIRDNGRVVAIEDGTGDRVFPSQCVDDAFQVVAVIDHVHGLPSFVLIVNGRNQPTEQVSASFGNPPLGMTYRSDECETTGLAICRAALKAVWKE
jgi:hypothetical protein